MSASRTREFRAFVYEWTCWDTVIEARTARAAKRKAEKLWDLEGPESFNLHDSGVDEIEAMERRPRS